MTTRKLWKIDDQGSPYEVWSVAIGERMTVALGPGPAWCVSYAGPCTLAPLCSGYARESGAIGRHGALLDAVNAAASLLAQREDSYLEDHRAAYEAAERELREHPTLAQEYANAAANSFERPRRTAARPLLDTLEDRTGGAFSALAAEFDAIDRDPTDETHRELCDADLDDLSDLIRMAVDRSTTPLSTMDVERDAPAACARLLRVAARAMLARDVILRWYDPAGESSGTDDDGENGIDRRGVDDGLTLAEVFEREGAL